MRIAILATLAFLIPGTRPGPWLTDFEAAKAAAAKDGKVIVARFIGSDWCGYCKKLETEVFSKPEFATWAEQSAILLEVDFPR